MAGLAFGIPAGLLIDKIGAKQALIIGVVGYTIGMMVLLFMSEPHPTDCQPICGWVHDCRGHVSIDAAADTRYPARATYPRLWAQRSLNQHGVDW
jgi:MFS-type transporter involved in bile tolerance (Atg22 family)